MVYRDGRKVKDTDSSEDESGPDTTLIPKSIVSGIDVKVGDSIKLKVVHIFDDELEVEYSHSRKNKDDKDDKDDSDKESSPDMDRANSDLDALAYPTEA